MIVDIFFILIVVYGLYLGFTKGVMRALLTLANVIVALVLALKISPMVAGGLESIFGSLSFAWLIISFFIVFLVAYWAIGWIIRLIDKTLRSRSIKAINKIFGGLILGLFFLLCYSMLIGFLDQSGMISETTKNNSKTWVVIENMPGASKSLIDKTKPLFREFWDKVNETTEE